MENKYEFDEKGNVNNIIKKNRRNKLYLFIVLGIILFQIIIIIILKIKDYNSNDNNS